MKTPILPIWVLSFCCMAPFVSLLVLSICVAFGATISTPGLLCLTLLCGHVVKGIFVIHHPIPQRDDRSL